MADIIVGVSDLKICDNIDDTLITYALGSCIAVAVYDVKAKIGGLLHFMLPDSSLDSVKALQKPEMFADTGIPLLFKSCYKLGAKKKDMLVKVVGGANILDRRNCFRIGQRNINSVRKIFWKNKVFIDGEDVGGNLNRTVRLEIATGKTSVYRARSCVAEI